MILRWDHNNAHLLLVLSHPSAVVLEETQMRRVCSLPSQPSMSVVLHFFFLYLLSTVQPDDLEILMKLKAAFQKSNTIVFDSWTAHNQPYNFTRVSCNSDCSVTSIELGNRNLVGVIPLDSLCQLPYLQKLGLGSNFIYGTIIDVLRKCSKLRYLDLGFNSFSATISSIRLHSRGGFEAGEVVLALELYHNQLTGKIPPGFGNLTGLTYFDASINLLEGDLTELRFLTRLVCLQLYGNQFSGGVPEEFGDLRNLVKLTLSMNQLRGYWQTSTSSMYLITT
ncbi:receptor-like protein kinase 7 [Macadamia integrifolia]|uniref:receptor-like protein kinase 7 n=1 Tax=Macadamia integrifolia TaxID=60698 RepID=UPI001C4E69EB|nr:receptor-like protein kinase 7 [Macadamia integrifolia]